MSSRPPTNFAIIGVCAFVGGCIGFMWPSLALGLVAVCFSVVVFAWWLLRAG